MKTASRDKAPAPGEVVPLRSSALRAEASWATAEAGTVRLSCEPEGAFAAVSDGAATPLPCEWSAAKDGVGSREIALEGRAALAEAGDVARLALTFEPDGGDAAIEETAEIRAYELKVEAAAEWPSNRSRHVFGPLEETVLSISPTTSQVCWRDIGVTNEDSSVTYKAPAKPCQENGCVDVDGATLGIELVTIAPTHQLAKGFRAPVDDDWMNNGQSTPDNGMIGAGIVITNLVLYPDWVSFENVRLKEGDCTATNMWGLFDFPGAETVFPPHGEDAGAGKVIEVGVRNDAGNDFAAATFLNIDQPWRAGGFQYDIPQYWSVKSGTHTNEWHWFGSESQVFTFDSNGDMTVEKFGVSMTRGTNGIYRITKEGQ